MNNGDMSPIIQRLESEILLQRQVICRAREAEADAQSDLAEARRELAFETARADDAERQRDKLLADEVARQDAADTADAAAKALSGEHRKEEDTWEAPRAQWRGDGLEDAPEIAAEPAKAAPRNKKAEVPA